MRPTPAGALLGELAGPILAGIEDAETRLEDLLQRSLPGMVVHPLVDETEGALRRLRAGEVDAVIVVEPYARDESPDDDLHRTHLLDDEYRILLPADHPLARRRTIDVAALADADWVVTSGPVQYVRAATDDVCRRAGFTPHVVAEGDEFSLTQGYVAVGLGVALAPLLALGAVRRHVAVRRLSPAPLPRHIWLVTRPPLAAQPALRALIDALRRASDESRAPH